MNPILIVSIVLFATSLVLLVWAMWLRRQCQNLLAEIRETMHPPVFVRPMGFKAEDDVLMDAKKFGDALPQFEGIKRPLNIDPVRMQQLRDEADERWDELQRARRADGQ